MKKPETPFWKVALLLIFWLLAFKMLADWGRRPELLQAPGKPNVSVLPYEPR